MKSTNYLINEHENHTALFKKIKGGDISALQELRSALIRHIRLEEKFLFTSCLRIEILEQDTRFAWEQHNLIMLLLQRLDEQSVGSPSWTAKVKLIEELHALHVVFEEGVFFPKIEQEFSERKLESIEDLMKRHRYDLLPDEILYPQTPGEHQLD